MSNGNKATQKRQTNMQDRHEKPQVNREIVPGYKSNNKEKALKTQSIDATHNCLGNMPTIYLKRTSF